MRSISCIALVLISANAGAQTISAPNPQQALQQTIDDRLAVEIGQLRRANIIYQSQIETLQSILGQRAQEAARLEARVKELEAKVAPKEDGK